MSYFSVLDFLKKKKGEATEFMTAEQAFYQTNGVRVEKDSALEKRRIEIEKKRLKRVEAGKETIKQYIKDYVARGDYYCDIKLYHLSLFNNFFEKQNEMILSDLRKWLESLGYEMVLVQKEKDKFNIFNDYIQVQWEIKRDSQ